MANGRPFFTDRATAQLRDMNVVNLTDLATVYHMEPAPRVTGQPLVMSRVVDATDVPCRLSSFSLRFPSERELAAAFGSEIKWICLFAAGYSVPADRRLIVTGITNFVPWTRYLEVIGEIIKTTEMFHHVACNNLAEAKR